MKNNRIFYLEIFSFLVVKFSIYLNRRVFVMPGICQNNEVENDSNLPVSTALFAKIYSLFIVMYNVPP